MRPLSLEGELEVNGAWIRAARTGEDHWGSGQQVAGCSVRHLGAPTGSFTGAWLGLY